jgi:hypothetical protein
MRTIGLVHLLKFGVHLLFRRKRQAEHLLTRARRARRRADSGSRLEFALPASARVDGKQFVKAERHGIGKRLNGSWGTFGSTVIDVIAEVAMKSTLRLSDRRRHALWPTPPA